MCRNGELLVIGAPQPFARLQYNFLSEQQLQRLQEHLLVRWPPMSATELAAGYSAINIDLNSDGAPPTGLTPKTGFYTTSTPTQCWPS